MLNCLYVVCILFVTCMYIYNIYLQLYTVKMMPCGHAYGPHKLLHSAGRDT